MPIFTVFFILLVAVFAAVVFFTEPSKTDKRIHSRLVSLDKKVMSDFDDEGGIVKEITFSNIQILDRFLRSNPIALKMQLLIEQADLNWTVGRLVFSMLVFVVIGAALGNWWISPSIMGWAPGVALGAVPYIFLVQKRNHRFRKFAQLLPDAIDLMSRSMRAGQALPSALELVADEVQEPLGPEFRRASDEQSFGLPFRESMMNLSRRVQIPDLQFLITAILVQKETGGNLAVILDKTAHVLRERVRVEGQTRIKTAQGRLTGWVLSGLPIGMFFGMNLVSPGYGTILFESETGRMMVGVSLVSLFLGMLVIRKIVSIEV